MVEECTINVGFHSNFGTFRQSGHSKIPLGSAIINRIPFHSTPPKKIVTNIARLSFRSSREFRCESPVISTNNSREDYLAMPDEHGNLHL